MNVDPRRVQPVTTIDYLNSVKVLNLSGSTIFRGSIARVVGVRVGGAYYLVEAAIAPGKGTLYVAEEDILAGTAGVVRKRAILGLDTSSAALGDSVWLSDSVAGGITLTEPTTSEPLGWVGEVGTDGQVVVDPDFATASAGALAASAGPSINGFGTAVVPMSGVVTSVGGRCLDSTMTFLIEKSTSITVDVNVSGVGGLDTGVIATDTTYALYVIADSSGASTVSALVSLDFDTPTLPSGYDKFRRISSLSTRTVGPNTFIHSFRSSAVGEDRFIIYTGEYAIREVFSGAPTVEPTSPRTEVDLSPLVSGAPYSRSVTLRIVNDSPGAQAIEVRSTTTTTHEMLTIEAGDSATFEYSPILTKLAISSDAALGTCTVHVLSYAVCLALPFA